MLGDPLHIYSNILTGLVCLLKILFNVSYGATSHSSRAIFRNALTVQTNTVSLSANQEENRSAWCIRFSGQVFSFFKTFLFALFPTSWAFVLAHTHVLCGWWQRGSAAAQLQASWCCWATPFLAKVSHQIQMSLANVPSFCHLVLDVIINLMPAYLKND